MEHPYVVYVITWVREHELEEEENADKLLGLHLSPVATPCPKKSVENKKVSILLRPADDILGSSDFMVRILFFLLTNG